MSSGYEVVLEAIETSAKAAKRASSTVGAVDLAGALYEVEPGLPGGASADAARQLANKWDQDVRTWTANTLHYADQLTSAVHHYRTNEQDAVHDLHAAKAPSHGGSRPI